MIQRPKGTSDTFLQEMETWQYIEETARILMNDYQFSEIRTPMFESYDLFSRSVGDTSDIVSKEMYDFFDKGKRHIALKPEGTAPIVRAYVENKLYGPEYPKPLKVYYLSPMFRYERPQGGRSRQFHQLGIEVLGSSNPAVDVEAMALAMDLLKEIGIQDIKLVMNCLGKKEDRLQFREALISYLEPFYEELSEDSKTRLHVNPLRVLDSKNKRDKEIVANAPSILDYLSEESKEHFDTVKMMLNELGISFEIDSKMVRGLDYYQDTIFEIVTNSPAFGAETTICGGGRYDGMVEEFGGPQTPGFGFGLGLERLVLLMNKQNVEIPKLNELDVFVVGLGKETNLETLKLVQAIRGAGFSADRDYMDRKAKTQFRNASRLEAKIVLTVGEEELEKKVVKLKVMKTGKEIEVSFSDIQNDFEKIFNKETADMTAYNEFFGKE
ncbi:histidine--tRNA ligase [Jeotgalibaca sp. MA1X17-3]|uniref:histidine--tRNA ligase n=1 Tax=Jeotgalibaca sp. MA1X17-3 TaxID=2908211 RepID=UPI001F01BD19|nr:histidine--tRNA ligase [Jeotgalibaca sp. MA1X17-3]UJF14718.1 histidine--tRNA ligase [Jeotgalibaca sp. MA1X17-3]